MHWSLILGSENIRKKETNPSFSTAYIFVIVVIIIVTSSSFLLLCSDPSMNSNGTLPHASTCQHSKLLLHIQLILHTYFASSEAYAHSVSNFLDLNTLNTIIFYFPSCLNKIKALISVVVLDKKTIMKNNNPLHLHSALHFSKRFHIDYIMISFEKFCEVTRESKQSLYFIDEKTEAQRR